MLAFQFAWKLSYVAIVLALITFACVAARECLLWAARKQSGAKKSSKARGDEHMIETKVQIDGMMCGMCEAHINDAIRRAFPVKKVNSRHARGEAVILSEQAIDPDRLHAVIDATGYRVLGISQAPYEKKKKLFGFRK